MVFRGEWAIGDGSLALALRPGPVGFDFDCFYFACEPMAVAAPWPVFGVFDQAALNRIAVDVAQLFHELSLCEDIEIIVPGLPEPVPQTSE